MKNELEGFVRETAAAMLNGRNTIVALRELAEKSASQARQQIEELERKLLIEGTDNMRLRDSLAKTQKVLAEEQDARKAAEHEADFCVCDYRPRRVCSVHPSRWKPAEIPASAGHPNG